MKMKYGFAILSAIVTLSFANAASLWDQLSSEEQKAIMNGQQVYKTEEVSDSAWPKVWVYQLVDGTPLESVAVFSDYEQQKNYISGLKRAEIIANLSATVQDVAYQLKSSIITSNYTVRDTLSAYDMGRAFMVSWTQLTGDQSKSAEGWAKFESLSNQTLMGYYNFVNPKSGLAGAVKDQAVKQVKGTAASVAKRVPFVRDHEDKSWMSGQVDRVRKALKL